MLAELLQRSFAAVIICSGLPLLASSLAGLIISVFQAATQIQEQSITYVVKFAVTAGVLTLCAGWYRAELSALMIELLSSMAYLGRL